MRTSDLVGGTVRQESQIAPLLKTLVPSGTEELSLLRFVLQCAQLMLQETPNFIVSGFQSHGAGLDVTEFLKSIPEEAQKYFHGLVEALEIYQSIHGHAFRVQTLSAGDKAWCELKQIREMCLEEGPRFVY